MLTSDNYLKLVLYAVFLSLLANPTARVVSQTGTPIPEDTLHYPMGASLLAESGGWWSLLTLDLRYNSGQRISLIRIAPMPPWLMTAPTFHSQRSVCSPQITSFVQRLFSFRRRQTDG